MCGFLFVVVDGVVFLQILNFRFKMTRVSISTDALMFRCNTFWYRFGLAGSFPIFLDLSLDLDSDQRPFVSFPVAQSPDSYSSDFLSELPP